MKLPAQQPNPYDLDPFEGSNPLDPTGQVQADVMPLLSDKEDLTATGYTENWGAMLGQTIDEDLGFVSRVINDDVMERNNKLSFMIHSSEIPREVSSTFVKNALNPANDYDGLAEWANNNLGTEFNTNSQEMRKETKDRLAANREVNQDVFGRAETMGEIGQFAGGAHAGMLDPATGLSMLVAPLGLVAASSSRLAYIAKFAGREAAVGGLAEAAIQPATLAWKEEIEVPYSVEDAIFQVMTTAALSGGIGAVVPAISSAGVLTDRVLGIPSKTDINQAAKSALEFPTVKQLDDAVSQIEATTMTRLANNEIDTANLIETRDALAEFARLREELKAAVKLDPNLDAATFLKGIDDMEDAFKAQTQLQRRAIQEIDIAENLLRGYSDIVDQTEAGVAKVKAQRTLDKGIDQVKADPDVTVDEVYEATMVGLERSMNDEVPTLTEKVEGATTVKETIEGAGASADKEADFVTCMMGEE